MSYVRWSSKLPITAPCGTCGREPWDESKGPISDRWEEWWAYDQCTGRISDPTDDVLGYHLCPECTSPWYIFAHVDGCLAIWYGGTHELPCYKPDEVSEILDRELFTSIPGWDGDPYGIVREAMRDYVEDYS